MQNLKIECDEEDEDMKPSVSMLLPKSSQSLSLQAATESSPSTSKWTPSLNFSSSYPSKATSPSTTASFPHSPPLSSSSSSSSPTSSPSTTEDHCHPSIKKRKIDIDKLFDSVMSLDRAARFDLWRKMLETHQFDVQQLLWFHTAIGDLIKLDIVSSVPYEIALYIMSFLSPKDLCSAAQTCKSWRVVCDDNRLWREKCEEEGLLNDENTLGTLFRKRIANSHRIQEKFVTEMNSALPKSGWKAAYLKHINILRNWRTRSFRIKEAFIGSPDQSTEPKRVQEQESQKTPNQQQQLQQLEIQLSEIEQQQLELKKLKSKQQLKPIQRQRYQSLQVLQIQLQQQQKDIIDQMPQKPLDSQSTTQEHSKVSLNTVCDHKTNEHEDNGKDACHLMQLPCHEDHVITCLQYNPRTHTIVSGSDDCTLKVWSSETGKCLATLRGHTGGVWSSQLSPDDIVISGATDRTVKIWCAPTGKLLHTLYGHTSTVRCLALDGDQVVSGSRDTTLRLWDINKAICLWVFVGHTAAVRCVEFKDGKIVSGAYDHLVMVWDAVSGTCIHTLERHANRIYSLQFDGKTIASGSLDSTICIWDADTGKLRHHLEGHESLTSKMQLKENLLVSANADSFCKVWDVNTGQCLQTLGGVPPNICSSKHTSAITSVYFNNRHVVTSSDDGTVKLWDIKTGKFIRNLIVLPTAAQGGVVWRIRASYTKLICAVGSRANTEDTHLLVLDFEK